MKTPIEPLGSYVVTQVQTAETTAGGLYLPNKPQPQPNMALVTAVGPDVKVVKVGDRIIFKSYTHTDIKIDDQEFLLVEEVDIIARTGK